MERSDIKSVTRQDQEVEDKRRRSMESENVLNLTLEHDNNSHSNRASSSPVDRLDIKQQNLLSTSPPKNSSPVNPLSSFSVSNAAQNMSGGSAINPLAQVQAVSFLQIVLI
jgi:hypothetical protein